MVAAYLYLCNVILFAFLKMQAHLCQIRTTFNRLDLPVTRHIRIRLLAIFIQNVVDRHRHGLVINHVTLFQTKNFFYFAGAQLLITADLGLFGQPQFRLNSINNAHPCVHIFNPGFNRGEATGIQQSPDITGYQCRIKFFAGFNPGMRHHVAAVKAATALFQHLNITHNRSSLRNKSPAYYDSRNYTESDFNESSHYFMPLIRHLRRCSHPPRVHGR